MERFRFTWSARILLQMAGTERNPDSAVWDEITQLGRNPELIAAITALGSSPLADIRQAAARVWGSSVQQVLHQLREEFATRLENAAVSDEGEQRRASWLAQLDTLTRAAEADLRGRASAAVGDAVDSPGSGSEFRAGVEDVSRRLVRRPQTRDIDKLLRSVGDTVATERMQPDWQRFEEMAATLRHEPSGPEPAPDDELIYGWCDRLAMRSNALRHYEQSRGLKLTSPASDALEHRPVLTGWRLPPLASVIAELAVIAEQFANRQRAANAAVQHVQPSPNLSASAKKRQRWHKNAQRSR